MARALHICGKTYCNFAMTTTPHISNFLMSPAQPAGPSNRPLPKATDAPATGNGRLASQDAPKVKQGFASLPVANNTPVKPVITKPASSQNSITKKTSEVTGKQFAKSVGKADGAFFEALVDQILSSADDKVMPVVQLADGVKPGFGMGKFTNLTGRGEVASRLGKLAQPVSGKMAPKAIVKQFQPAAPSGKTQQVVQAALGGEGLLVSLNKPQVQGKAIGLVKGETVLKNRVVGEVVDAGSKPVKANVTQIQTQTVAPPQQKMPQTSTQIIEVGLKGVVAGNLQQIMRPQGSKASTNSTLKRIRRFGSNAQSQFAETGKFKLNGPPASPAAVEAITAQASGQGSKPKLQFGGLAQTTQAAQSGPGVTSQAETAQAAQSSGQGSKPKLQFGSVAQTAQTAQSGPGVTSLAETAQSAQSSGQGSKAKLQFGGLAQTAQSGVMVTSPAETVLSAQPAKAPAGPAQAPVAEPIGQQIALQVQARPINPGQQITVQLNPPELGKVQLQVHQDDQGLRAVLEVENPRTLSQLQREAPGLVNRLAEGGVQVNRIEVTLANSSDSSDRNGSEPFGSLMRDNYGNQRDNQAGDTSQQSESGYTDGYGLDESDESLVLAGYVNDETINVWR